MQTAAAPATLTFTILTAPDVEKVRLIDGQGTPLSMGILFTREDGYIRWSCTVKFNRAYHGKVRAFVLAADGFWADSGYEVDVSVD